MKIKPIVSVLMSVYNTEFRLTQRAIESVLKQDYDNFELIVIDDGSNTDTNNELLKFVKLHEHKITYLRHANVGQAESINRGVLNSKGNYITIIDSDDEYLPNHISACLQEIQGFDLIASQTKTIVNSPHDYFVPDKDNYSQLIHVDDCILFATLFGKKEVFMNIQFNGEYAADARFYELVSETYKVKKTNLRTYVYYRNNPHSTVALLKEKIK